MGSKGHVLSLMRWGMQVPFDLVVFLGLNLIRKKREDVALQQRHPFACSLLPAIVAHEPVFYHGIIVPTVALGGTHEGNTSLTKIDPTENMLRFIRQDHWGHLNKRLRNL